MAPLYVIFMTFDAEKILKRPSPNHDARKPADNTAYDADTSSNTTPLIDMLVLHYTGMQSGSEALKRLCDPAAKVSAHYLIEEDGRIFQLVDEAQRAWHAGVSHWRGHNDINARSIGIEIVNPGHEWGYRPFSDAQIAALIPLCQAIIARYNIPARNIVGHSDVAPARKQDPGELFPWEHLAKAGIGLWVDVSNQEDFLNKRAAVGSTALVTSAQAEVSGSSREAVSTAREQHKKKLTTFGYSPDAPLPATITAFQRHFRPTKINGIWDSECDAIIRALLAALD